MGFREKRHTFYIYIFKKNLKKTQVGWVFFPVFSTLFFRTEKLRKIAQNNINVYFLCGSRFYPE